MILKVVDYGISQLSGKFYLINQGYVNNVLDFMNSFYFPNMQHLQVLLQTLITHLGSFQIAFMAFLLEIRFDEMLILSFAQANVRFKIDKIAETTLYNLLF